MITTITIQYSNKLGVSLVAADSSFDWDHYEKKHMPLVAKVFGSRLIDYNIIKPTENYHAVATLFLDGHSDQDAYSIFLLRRDIVDFTNANYDIILGEIAHKKER